MGFTDDQLSMKCSECFLTCAKKYLGGHIFPAVCCLPYMVLQELSYLAYKPAVNKMAWNTLLHKRNNKKSIGAIFGDLAGQFGKLHVEKDFLGIS